MQQLVVTLAVVLIGAPARPQDGDPIAAPVRRVFAVAELVLENHINPPSRQELILAAARALYAGAGQLVPDGFSRRLSGLTDIAALQQALLEVWTGTAPGWQGESPPGTAMLEAIADQVRGQGRLIPARDFAVDAQVAANQYVGTGIALSMGPGEARPVMKTVFAGGPAADAGARDGDVIERIDDADTRNMTLRQVVDLLRGPKGSNVTVVLRQPGDATPRTYTITRGVVPLATITGYRLHTAHAQPTVGYLRLESIGASAVHELRTHAQRMKADDVRALVLDARETAGGSIHHAVLLADALLDGGAIGGVQTKHSTRTYTASRDALLEGMPLAILVGGATGGDTEWLVAALQDNGRAQIVGTRTAGDYFVRRGIEIEGADVVFLMATGVLTRGDGTRLGHVEPDHLAPDPELGAEQAAALLRAGLAG